MAEGHAVDEAEVTLEVLGTGDEIEPGLVPTARPADERQVK
jgi:hypothetical protein